MNFSDVVLFLRNNWRIAAVFTFSDEIIFEGLVIYQAGKGRGFREFVKSNEIVELAAKLFQAICVVATKGMTLVGVSTLVNNRKST